MESAKISRKYSGGLRRGSIIFPFPLSFFFFFLLDVGTYLHVRVSGGEVLLIARGGGNEGDENF